MIVELLTAIKERYDSDAGAALRAALGHTATTPKFWFDFAPGGTVHPLIEYRIPACGMDYTMGQDLPLPLVQFDVYDRWHRNTVGDMDKSPLRAMQCADLLVALYNTADIQMSNGYDMIRADPVVPGRTPESIDEGWWVIVEYRYMLEVIRP